MLDMHALASALHILGSSAGCWVWILPGLIIGLAGSAMPGAAISVTMAVVLPLTLQMDLMPSLVFLTSVYTGGVFGGSVPAILMNIPGTPASYATTFDGYPMTLKGEHNEALGYALFSSTLCCIVGYIVLLLVIEPMAHLVIKVGPLEMLIVALWGLALLGSLGSEYVTRGFLAAAFGILISTDWHEYGRVYPRHIGHSLFAGRCLADRGNDRPARRWPVTDPRDEGLSDRGRKGT